MATLIPSAKSQPGDVLRCVEVYFNGSRPRITIGRVNGRDGEDFRRRIDEVIGDLRLGRQHSGSLCDWLKALSPKIQSRLEKAGLMKASQQTTVLLGDLLDSIKDKARVKESTLITYSNPIRNLIDHFGRNRPLRSIDHVAALDFEEYLHSPTAAYDKRPLSKATINRRIIMCRQFFKIAVTRHYITENPFANIKAGSQRNKKRLVFVEAAWVDKMITSTTNDDWKVLLVLGRYGGLRLPSEVAELRWKHVDFDIESGSILVHSPKTEHHEGKETRYVPLLDEIREVLTAVYAKGVRADDFVIQNPKYRHPKANLRTQFLKKVAKKARVKPWPKAFQNLRATRETELIKLIGLTEACEIIGNSPTVALLHYDMVSPEYMTSAIERARGGKKAGVKSGVTNVGFKENREETSGQDVVAI